MAVFWPATPAQHVPALRPKTPIEVLDAPRTPLGRDSYQVVGSVPLMPISPGPAAEVPRIAFPLGFVIEKIELAELAEPLYGSVS